MSPGPTADATVEQLVRVAFFVRLVSLVVALGGLVGSQLTGTVYAAVVLLGLASYVFLALPHARGLLVRHPLLAMSDLALVVWVVTLLGVSSPLVLATVSTALLVGVLYPVPFALLPAAVLVLAHAGEAWTERTGAPQDFVAGFGMSAVLAMLVGVGQAVRRIQAAERATLATLAAEREATAAERERTRLAREMHDGMAKSLQGLALTASALPTWVDRDADRARAEARVLAEGAGRAVDEARTLLTRLRQDDPAQDLATVVEQVCQAWSATAGRHVEVDASPVPALPTQVRYELLAALREALENVRQHAPGARVLVRLEPAPGGGVQARVADDGPGYDPAVLPQREAQGHFGVRGMAERMQSVGGSAHVETGPGAGTTVVLTVPQQERGARRGRRVAP